jgi:succinate dehydrogenase/fumarate reductase flavoprotein subunit
MTAMTQIETEILVVGGGGSGLASAIELAAGGAKVLLIEKNPKVGGSTGMSVGSLTAAGTADQRRRGIFDSAEAHYDDMPKFDPTMANRDNLDLRRLLTENANDSIVWLRSLGVEFFGPLEEPPHRVARMHNVLPSSRSYIYHLVRRARALGVDIRVNTMAKRIVVEAGRATAIEAQGPGPTILRLNATRAIILAGGDYSNSPEMKRMFGAHDTIDVPGVNPTATGDCQRMVMEIGGEVVNGDLVLGPILRFAPPDRPGITEYIPPFRLMARLMRWALNTLPATLIRPFVMSFMTTWMGPETRMLSDGAILVGTTGHSIPLAGRSPGQAIAQESSHAGYLVFDSRVAAMYSGPPHFLSTAPGIAYAYLGDYRRSRRDLFHTGQSAAQLAASTGLPSDAFVSTLNVMKGWTLPFYALGPLHAYVGLTDGGVRISTAFEVLSTKGNVIPGLFAAGSTGQGGLLLNGHGHHIVWAITSGRLAARSVLAKKSS